MVEFSSNCWWQIIEEGLELVDGSVFFSSSRRPMDWWIIGSPFLTLIWIGTSPIFRWDAVGTTYDEFVNSLWLSWAGPGAILGFESNWIRLQTHWFFWPNSFSLVLWEVQHHARNGVTMDKSISNKTSVWVWIQPAIDQQFLVLSRDGDSGPV